MNLRQVTTSVLSRVIKDGQSLTAALDHSFKSIDDKKDRAFIQALSFGVIRRYHRLDFILQQLLAKPLRNKDTDIKMLLLMGLYQLQYMRVKSHAAVSETVTASKRKSWAKALINGVLREYIREQASYEAAADKNWVASHSHPEWLIDLIKADWLKQYRQIIDENNQQPPMVLRVNVTKIEPSAYLELLVEQGIAAKLVDFCATAIVLEQAVVVEKLPKFFDGFVSVQDTAAQLSAQLLDVQAGQTVLDLCAAPGGKTAAIIECQPALKSILAIDIDESRLTRVNENLQRLNFTAKLKVGDATKPHEWADSQTFDRILVDAPCSALGVIRRHPDIKILRRDSDIEALQTIQRQILTAAWELLNSGGILLYATCSVLKQENEEQIQAFLVQQQDASEIIIDAEWGIARPYGRQILTGDSAMDGFYYAKLLKS